MLKLLPGEKHLSLNLFRCNYTLFIYWGGGVWRSGDNLLPLPRESGDHSRVLRLGSKGLYIQSQLIGSPKTSSYRPSCLHTNPFTPEPDYLEFTL